MKQNFARLGLLLFALLLALMPAQAQGEVEFFRTVGTVIAVNEGANQIIFNPDDLADTWVVELATDIEGETWLELPEVNAVVTLVYFEEAGAKKVVAIIADSEGDAPDAEPEAGAEVDITIGAGAARTECGGFATRIIRMFVSEAYRNTLQTLAGEDVEVVRYSIVFTSDVNTLVNASHPITGELVLATQQNSTASGGSFLCTDNGVKSAVVNFSTRTGQQLDSVDVEVHSD